MWFFLAGEEWRKMTNLDKLPYARLAEQEKQKYGEAMKGYNMVNIPSVAKSTTFQ